MYDEIIAETKDWKVDKGKSVSEDDQAITFNKGLAAA